MNNPENLTEKEINTRIGSLLVSIRICAIKTGSHVNCKNRIKRVKLLQSYLLT